VFEHCDTEVPKSLPAPMNTNALPACMDDNALLPQPVEAATWTRADMLALLQLLAMVLVAAVQASWSLIVHRREHPSFLHVFVLMSLKSFSAVTV
jgi:hypothetical protein